MKIQLKEGYTEKKWHITYLSFQSRYHPLRRHKHWLRCQNWFSAVCVYTVLNTVPSKFYPACSALKTKSTTLKDYWLTAHIFRLDSLLFKSIKRTTRENIPTPTCVQRNLGAYQLAYPSSLIKALRNQWEIKNIMSYSYYAHAQADLGLFYTHKAYVFFSPLTHKRWMADMWKSNKKNSLLCVSVGVSNICH